VDTRLLKEGHNNESQPNLLFFTLRTRPTRAILDRSFPRWSMVIDNK